MSFSPVLQLKAGTNITLSPTNGQGIVTINASGGGGSGITQLTGDATAGPGSGSQVLTLASVATAGTSAYPSSVTIDVKGRVTSITAGTQPQPLLSLTATDILYATGSSTVGQDNTFTYTSGTHTLAVTNAHITALSNLTSNGFVKTSGGTGTLSVDTTSYQPILSLTTTDVLFATGASTVGQDNTFTYDNVGQILYAANSILSGTLAVPNITTNSGALSISPAGDLDLSAGGHIVLVAFGGAGFVKTNGSNQLILDTNTYLSGSLSNTDILYATGSSTIGQDSNFTYTHSTSTLAVPTVAGNGTLNLDNTASYVTQVSLGTTHITVTGNTLPASAVTYNLGGSGSGWNNLYVGSVIGQASSATVLTLQNANTPNTSIVLGASAITVTGNTVPAATTTYNLGANGSGWNDLYVGSVIGQASGGNLLVLQNSNSPATILSLGSSAITVTGQIASATGNLLLADASVSPVATIHLTTSTSEVGITAGTVLVIDDSGHQILCTGTNSIGFFSATTSLVGQQTGGSFTFGATYTSAEQAKCQVMWNALRSYGLLS